MAWQYMLNKKAHLIVRAIWDKYKDGDFTTTDVANVMGVTSQRCGSTLGSLAARKVVERTNGDKRSHYQNRKTPTRWRFTEKFKAHYEKRYLSGCE